MAHARCNLPDTCPTVTYTGPLGGFPGKEYPLWPQQCPVQYRASIRRSKRALPSSHLQCTAAWEKEMVQYRIMIARHSHASILTLTCIHPDTHMHLSRHSEISVPMSSTDSAGAHWSTAGFSFLQLQPFTTRNQYTSGIPRLIRACTRAGKGSHYYHWSACNYLVMCCSYQMVGRMVLCINFGRINICLSLVHICVAQHRFHSPLLS